MTESDFVSEDSEDVISSSDDERQPDTSNLEVSKKLVDDERDEEEDAAGVDPDFVRELEFVQCLANPEYIWFLVQRNFFGDHEFMNYLKYLLYWTRPEYAKYIRYPQGIQFLILLQDPDFITYISIAQNVMKIQEQQRLFWERYRIATLDASLPEVTVKMSDDVKDE